MTATRPTPRAAALWGVLFLALWGIALLATMTVGVNVGDELWFLQVITRVAEGEVLYRDVFFNTTPGAAALGVAMIKVLGSDVIVVKLLVSFAVAAGSLCCGIAARTLGASQLAALTVAVAGVTFGASTRTSPYTPLAAAATAACLLAVLQWRAGGSRRSARWLAVAGAAVGVSFAFKHSIGVATAAALAFALVLDRRALTGRGLAGCAAAAAGAALLPLLVVLAQGGGPRLWEYGVSAKRAYVEHAGVSWWTTIKALRDEATSGSPRGVLSALVPVLPFVVGVSAAAALAFGRERATTAISLAFALAALINIYPRADLSHFLPAAPLLAFCLWLTLHQLAAPPAASLLRIGGLAVVAASAVLVISELRVITSSERVLSSVPHVRGVWLAQADQRRFRDDARRLASAAAGQPTLVITGDAGGRYLVAGVPNRTPYDFPLASAFGLSGEAETAAAVSAGRFPVVCLSTDVPAGLAARQVEEAIQQTMTPAESAGTCRVYRMPAGR